MIKEWNINCLQKVFNITNEILVRLLPHHLYLGDNKLSIRTALAVLKDKKENCNHNLIILLESYLRFVEKELQNIGKLIL